MVKNNKRLGRFFIKDFINNISMGKTNNSNNNANNNPAASDDVTGNDAKNAAQPELIVAIDAHGNPIDEGKNIQAPQQEQQPTPSVVENAGEVKENTPIAAGKLQPQVEQEAQEVKGNVNIADVLNKTTGEIRAGDVDQDARVKKAKLLTDAINSRFYFEDIKYVNSETGEEKGSKLRYTQDPNGKTIYDYMNDPEVTAHLGFKLLDEEDPQDGSIVTKQISIYWVNPVF